MSLSVDQPYPSLDDVKEDRKALRIVSPAYAGRDGELTAILQYVYQSVLLGANGKEREAKLLLDIAVVEMHHLQILGTLITKLGAPPVFTACPPYPVSYYSASCVNYTRSLASMISADICAEHDAISEYTRMLCGLKNPAVAAVIERIREDERLHLNLLEQLEKELKCGHGS